MTRVAARRGRPPLPVEVVRSAEVKVRVTDAEHAELAAWAEREGVSLSTVLGSMGLVAARASADRAARRARRASR